MEERELPAPTISHVICTTGLVLLIFVMPFFYAIVVNNIDAEMMKRELREIADYVSNTMANLYFLVNSTSYSDVSLEKELVYLPSAVENSLYIVEIVESGGNASKITAYLKNKSSVAVDSWLAPGLKVGAENYVESGRTVVAGCGRNGTGVYAWIRYG
jgi:CRISPR/Cas system-associated endonuclease/helicase Cas3